MDKKKGNKTGDDLHASAGLAVQFYTFILTIKVSAGCGDVLHTQPRAYRYMRYKNSFNSTTFKKLTNNLF